MFLLSISSIFQQAATICGSRASQFKVPVDSVHVEQSVIPFSDAVRDLGFFLDKNLLMTNRISSIVRSCFFHLLSLGKLRQYLNRETANTNAVSLVLPRLHYCNSCLWGMPKNKLLRLQRVQNTASRIITQTKRSDRIVPILRELHWLPVEMEIDYKILSLVYSCMNGRASPNTLRN